MVSPASSAIGLSCCTPVRTSSDIQRSIIFEPPLESVARLPSGAGLPGWYLPLSTPCAIGDQTIWERPSSSDVGITSASMTRHSMEYCGWLEISWKPRSLARAWPSRIWLGRPLADADVEGLALPHDVREGLHRLFQRGLVVVAVGLVEVHVVRLQPASASR